MFELSSASYQQRQPTWQLSPMSLLIIGMSFIIFGTVLVLCNSSASTLTLWTPPPSIDVFTRPSSVAPLFAKGFGKTTPKKTGGKKPKSVGPEPFIKTRDPAEESNLPIEKLPTTIYDHFNAGPPPEGEVDPGVVGGLEILKFPDPRLRMRSEEVPEENILSGEAAVLARKMFDIMYASDGIGLAAPQVGINKRIIVYNPEGDRSKWQLEQVLINPKIVSFSKRIIDAPEGCLSFPKIPKIRLPFQKLQCFDGLVWRPDEITVRATNLENQESLYKFSGWAARIFQHEYDHLDGICWIDRLEDDERMRLDPFIQDLISNYGEGGAIAPLDVVPRWRSLQAAGGAKQVPGW